MCLSLFLEANKSEKGTAGGCVGASTRCGHSGLSIDMLGHVGSRWMMNLDLVFSSTFYTNHTRRGKPSPIPTHTHTFTGLLFVCGATCDTDRQNLYCLAFVHRISRIENKTPRGQWMCSNENAGHSHATLKCNHWPITARSIRAVGRGAQRQ